MDRIEQISRRLKLRQLSVLAAVVQCGSMAKAASRLAITQPVVSKAIADLENTLGVRLLDRGPKGVDPRSLGGREANPARRHGRLADGGPFPGAVRRR